MNARTIEMLVFCRNASGQPDIFRTQLRCTQALIDAGDHYEQAFDRARAEGYEPQLAADENDPAFRAFQETGGYRQGDPAGQTRYVCQVEVKDPLTGLLETLEVHFDKASGAMFAVDATFVDQVSDCVVSPYSGATLLFAEPDSPPAHGLQVALPKRDLQDLADEVRALRLQLESGLGWRAARKDAAVEVYAFVQGGVLQSLSASEALNVTVIDYDVERGAGALRVDFPPDHGGGAEVSVGDMAVPADPAACRALATAIEQAHAEVPRHAQRGG